MKHYNFFIQGPDDDCAEEVNGGTELEFKEMLGRYTMDDILTMKDPSTGHVVRCEHGRNEC